MSAYQQTMVDEMYYHHFMGAIFENVDGIIKIEPMIPSQIHTKN